MGAAAVAQPRLPEDPSTLDPASKTGTLICAFGKKASGKSHLVRRLWREWPLDAFGIEVNDDLDAGPDVERLHELPAKFPVDHAVTGERRHRKVVWRADAGAASYRDDLDLAIGVALRPSDNKTLVWIDEIGEVSQGRRPTGNLRKLLMQSRHFGPVSALMGGPRPGDIDPLVYLEADPIYEFELPDPNDREKMRRLMGFDSLDEHDAVWSANRARHGDYSFLFFHAPSGIVLACPPVPLD